MKRWIAAYLEWLEDGLPPPTPIDPKIEEREKAYQAKLCKWEIAHTLHAEGHTYKEVAERLGISKGQAERWCHRHERSQRRGW